jgi:hypothetical protein
MCLRFLWDGGRFAIGTNADLNLRGGFSACGAAAAGTPGGDMESSGSLTLVCNHQFPDVLRGGSPCADT